MTDEALKIACADLRELTEENPDEMELVVEMLIEADEELCADLT